MRLIILLCITPHPPSPDPGAYIGINTINTPASFACTLCLQTNTLSWKVEQLYNKFAVFYILTLCCFVKYSNMCTASLGL